MRELLRWWSVTGSLRLRCGAGLPVLGGGGVIPLLLVRVRPRVADGLGRGTRFPFPSRCGRRCRGSVPRSAGSVRIFCSSLRASPF